jgi:superfamily II DNA helicase RecQ
MLARAITQKAGVAAKPYHAGLKKDERNNVQELWSKNEVQVAVATVRRIQS